MEGGQGGLLEGPESVVSRKGPKVGGLRGAENGEVEATRGQAGQVAVLRQVLQVASGNGERGNDCQNPVEVGHGTGNGGRKDEMDGKAVAEANQAAVEGHGGSVTRNEGV